VGDFNDWNEEANPMTLMGSTEIWETFVEGLERFDTYKYCVYGCDGKKHMKCDPYGTHMEVAPDTGSKIFVIENFPWGDGKWHPFIEMPGLYCYNGKFSGVFTRAGGGSGIIDPHMNKRVQPTYFAEGNYGETF
jgi:hypothetical protein